MYTGSKMNEWSNLSFACQVFIFVSTTRANNQKELNDDEKRLDIKEPTPPGFRRNYYPGSIYIRNTIHSVETIGHSGKYNRSCKYVESQYVPLSRCIEYLDSGHVENSILEKSNRIKYPVHASTCCRTNLKYANRRSSNRRIYLWNNSRIGHRIFFHLPIE